MDTNLKKIRQVLWIVLLLNLAVSLAKSLMGYLTKSNSMMADGFHSLADSSSNVIGLIGIAAAMKPEDQDHPYGHKKFETFAALGIAALLLIAIISILHEAWGRLENPVIPQISIASFIVMLFTLAVNILVVKYEKKQGEILKSDILISDAYHTTSDIYVSVSVIITLVAIKFGLVWLDTLASLVIAGFIAHAAWEIVSRSSSVLCDQAMLDEAQVTQTVIQVAGVEGCHKIRSRGRSDDLKVDLHIQVNPRIAVAQAHEISHLVAEALCREHQGVSDVVVHIEPANH